MVKIGLLSDTHSHLDPKIFEYFQEVDEIWHAGDIGSIEVTDQLKKFKRACSFITFFEQFEHLHFFLKLHSHKNHVELW